MDLTFIVTIDPIKSISYLNVLVHSLNLQTGKNFNVVFYNQTRLTEQEALSSLEVAPAFAYEWHDLDRSLFFGKYPLWDLYAFHDSLLRSNRLNPYFMALHMEEFLDVDYVEKASGLLQERRFDILFGNLRRTTFDLSAIAPILKTTASRQFDAFLRETHVNHSPHWAYQGRRKKNKFYRLFYSNLGRNLRATFRGYFTPSHYREEDVYLMSVSFAKRHNWFLSGHSMYMEDIHICNQPGVCELGKELKKITRFPVYFNASRIYHLEHEKYYFQLLDPEFTKGVLELRTDDPIMQSLQKAIRGFQTGELKMEAALKLSRQNSEKAGTQDLNYQHHMRYLDRPERTTNG